LAAAQFDLLLKSSANGVLKTRRDDEVLLFRLFLCMLLQNQGDLANFYLDHLSQSGETPAWYYANAARFFRNNKKSEARRLLSTAKILYPNKMAFFDASNDLLGYR